MVKFLNKNRKKLLSNRRYRNYILYAIGEIALVVIGILIALQINNWNEARKNKEHEIQYLKGIYANLNEDIAELEGHLKSDTVQLDAFTFMVRILNADQLLTTPGRQLANNWIATTGVHWFEGQNVVFDDMKSSGRMHFIQSDSLKLQIQTYYSLFNEVIKQEEFHNEIIQDYSKEMLSEIYISPLVEQGFPERWNGNVNSPDFTSIIGQINGQVKLKFIENYTNMKNMLFLNKSVRSDLLEQGITLRKAIQTYLATQK